MAGFDADAAKFYIEEGSKSRKYSSSHKSMKKPPNQPTPDYVTLLTSRSPMARVRMEGPTISISGRQILLSSGAS